MIFLSFSYVCESENFGGFAASTWLTADMGEFDDKGAAKLRMSYPTAAPTEIQVRYVSWKCQLQGGFGASNSLLVICYLGRSSYSSLVCLCLLLLVWLSGLCLYHCKGLTKATAIRASINKHSHNNPIPITCCVRADKP